MRLFTILYCILIATVAMTFSCGDADHTFPWCGSSSSGSSSSGSSSSSGAGGYHNLDWCDLLTKNDAACMGCAFAPTDDAWCANEAASPCAIVGMVPVACGWSAPADASCIEVGAYACGEMGRLVCCPVDGGPGAANPACVNGPGDCIDFGDCIDAYCGLDGACYYDRRASGAPCGDGGACGNGICE